MDFIGIKYCGGCNPLIDRSRLVREIEGLLGPGSRLTTDVSSTPWKIGILLCGCLRACIDRPDVRGHSRNWIRVGGATIDLESVHEDKMATVIAEKIHLLNMKEKERAK